MALNDLDQMRVRQAIARHFDVSGDSVRPETRIMSDLDGDSLDTVEVLMAIEEEFMLDAMDVPESDDPTVQDYINLFDRKDALH